MSKRSFLRRFVDWLNEEDRPKTNISTRNNTVSVVSSGSSVNMPGGNITIRGQRGPVRINGSVYNEGDPLPEGVDITWA